MEPRFVVAGTGRSGSGYISRLLRTVDIECGHEEWWSIHRGPNENLDGDSSWLACPELRDYEGLWFHQMRHPLKVIASLNNGELLYNWTDPWFKERIKPLDTVTGDSLVDSINVYLAFFEMADEMPHMRWRVEDMNPQLLCEIAETVGQPISMDLARAAWRGTSQTFNKHHTKQILTLDELPEGEPKQRVLSIINAHYGDYHVAETVSLR